MYNYTCNRCGNNFENKNKGKKYCSYFCAKQWAKGPKTCKHCGNEFNRKGTTAKYCSQVCAKAATKAGCDLPCKQCGTMFYVPGTKLRRHKKNQFCSWDCNMAWQRARRPIRICKNCGIEFKKKARANAMYCSTFCKLNSKENIEHLAKIRAGQQVNETKLETMGYSILERMGIIFEKQYLYCQRYVADCYLPEYNTLVQFDGDFWHGNPSKYSSNLCSIQLSNKGNDCKADMAAKNIGYNVERFWENDVYHNTNLVEYRLGNLKKDVKSAEKNRR